MMATEPIFKFVNLRGVTKTTPKRVSSVFVLHPTKDQVPFHKQFEEIAEAERHEKGKHLAKKFLSSDAYMPGVSEWEQAQEALQQAKTIEEIKKALPLHPDPKDPELRSRLWGTAYALSILNEGNGLDEASVFFALRILNLSDLADQMELSEPLNGEKSLSAPILVPKTLISEGQGHNVPEERTLSKESERALATLRDLTKQLNVVKAAVKDLDAAEVAASQTHREPVISDVTARITDVPTEFHEFGLTEPQRLRLVELARNEELEKVLGSELEEVSFTFRSVDNLEPFLAHAESRLQPQTKELVSKIKGAKGKMSSELKNELEGDLEQKVRIFMQGVSPSALQDISMYPEMAEIMEAYAVPFVHVPYRELDLSSGPAEGSPTARGIRPLGIGDLFVVEQELLGYEEGEIAHIENVLKSEEKSRVHRRERETEETFLEETENTEESEKNLQSTERFEMQREAERVISSTVSLNAGFSVSASYGVVSASAHGGFALTRSSSDSRKAASNYAKEVTERSRELVVNRSKQQRTRRALERFMEENTHGLDNSQGDGHITGIYQWLNKRYRVQNLNYGKRLMFEFIVPEPAAFFKHVNTKQVIPDLDIEPPSAPTIYGRNLKPSDLTRYNYLDFVARYNAQDIDAYPDTRVKVSEALANAPAPEGNNKAFAAKETALQVPEGYEAWGYVYAYHIVGNLNTNYFLSLLMAGRSSDSFDVSGLSGTVPISVSGSGKAYNVSVAITCNVTPEHIEKWQLKTFNGIMDAYQNKLMEYNEALAAARISAGIEISGRNPLTNRQIEREELKKHSLDLLTDNYARLKVTGTWRMNEVFNAAYEGGDYGYPDFNREEALIEGKIIQFFEQAFEWENMTYRFYPYFWGRKQNWEETFSFDDPDSKFNDFLRAGSARVVVPVNPSYDKAILHYLHTNELWNAGDVPTINDPLYVSIIEELRSEQEDRTAANMPACSINSGYPCIDDSWEMVLPTSLVYLKQDGVLPTPDRALLDVKIDAIRTVNPDSHLSLELSAPLPEGTWQLHYKGQSVLNVSDGVGRSVIRLEWPTQPDWYKNDNAYQYHIRLVDVVTKRSIVVEHPQ